MTGRGMIRWGVKESFRAYIDGLPDGEVAVTNGASHELDGRFTWPLVAADGGVFRAAGEVRLGGHGGMLAVSLSELRVTVEGDTAVIAVGGEPVRIARGTVTTNTDRGLLIETTVTTMGSELLGGVYPVGTALDHLEIDVDSDSSERP
jgi:hypothetical protein